MNKLLGKKGGALGKKKDTDEGGESKTKSSLIQNILGAKLIKVKIAVITIVPILFLFLLLFVIFLGEDVALESSMMCSTESSSTYNGEGYTGSADMLDFACSSQHPLANKGKITSWSVSRWGSQHEGIDIGVEIGTPVYAVQAGTVTLAGVEDAYGNTVVIAHTDAISTRYAHNSELLVKVGDKVAKGQMIAKSGNTGRSTGPHLHFEFVYNGQRQYDVQNQYFGIEEKNGAEQVSSLVGEDFKKQCGSKWTGELAGDSASQANDTSDSVISTSSSSSSEDCCISDSDSSSSSGTDCPNGITLIAGDNDSGHNKDPDLYPIGTFSLDDYIQMVVAGENTGVGIEALKAQMIAAKSYALYVTDNCSKPIKNSTEHQVAKRMEDVTDDIKKAFSEGGNSVITYNGAVLEAKYSSFLGICVGGMCTGSSVKFPSSEKVTYIMPEKYLTTREDAGHGIGMSQNYAGYLADQGKTYKEILEYFYADGIEINGSSNTCSIGGKFDGKIYQYYQTDYNDKLCSNLSTTIYHTGCAPTSMAVVLSSLLKEEHDPIEISKIACSNNRCTNTYCSSDLFYDVAKKYNLSVRKISPEDNDEVKAQLNNGKTMVIALMTPTGSNPFARDYSHFIVLYGIEGNKVAIWDPYRDHNVNDKTYDLDQYFTTSTVGQYWAFSKN